jgi:hypothetical protein
LQPLFLVRFGTLWRILAYFLCSARSQAALQFHAAAQRQSNDRRHRRNGRDHPSLWRSVRRRREDRAGEDAF